MRTYYQLFIFFLVYCPSYFSPINAYAAIDLSVTNNSLGSSSVIAGSSLVVYCAERNFGSTNAGANVISVHLSYNTTLTPGANGDIWIGDINVSSCPANSTTSILNTTSIALPTSLISGTYYIFFSADGGQVYNESDETNNFAYLPISVNACNLPTPTGLFPGGVSSNPATITSTTPTLQWNSIPNATCYGVYIRDVVSNILIYNNDAATTTNSFNVPAGLLSTNGQYKWNCLAKSNCSNTSCLSSGATTIYFNVSSGCNAVTINASGQPLNQTTNVGGTAMFSVTPSGTAPFSYQWRKNGNNISGANSSSYTTPSLSLSDNGSYYSCYITNCSNSSTTSNSALLTVNNSCIPVTIVLQPQNQIATVNSTATFTVTANGTPPFSYQWLKNGSIILGANSATYTTPTLSQSDNGSSYSCYVTNCNNSNVTSSQATLTVNSNCTPVSITSNNQPQNQTAILGGTATFSISPSGTAPFTYQWRKNGILITGATNQSYTTPTLSMADNGSTYMCYVENCGGANYIYSNSVSLTVSNATSAPTANFSVSQNNITLGSTITTTNNSSGNPTPNYLWSVSPSTGISFSPNSTATNPTITFPYAGTYTVTLTASNTNGTNSTSKTINVNPNSPAPTYWIGFYTKVEQNTALNWEKLIASGTSNTPISSLSPAKICADGSSSTIIKVNCSDTSLDMTQISCKILEGNDNLLYGDFTNALSTPSLKAIRFKHPDIMNWNQTYRPLTIQIFNVNNPNIILATYPIHLYRAPLLMVHGLWGNVGSFLQMENYLKNNNLYPTNNNSLILRLDYEESNDSGFGYNSQRVPIGINQLLYNLRNSDFSAGKVVIVAHSMGGLLTRIYLENLHQTNYRDDIQKFITLNTPHSGTQAANMLLYRQNWCKIIKGIMVYNYSFLQSVNNILNLQCPPAIQNLCVNSYEIDNLNNPIRLSMINTPTYAIVTEDFYINDNTDCSSLINFIEFISLDDSISYLNGLFNNEYSDLIVPISSQLGGISSNQTFSYQCHLKSPVNTSLMVKVRDLIDSIPSSNNFDINGFIPPTLTVPDVSNFRSDDQNSNINVAINSPVNDASFNSGATITILTSGDNSVNRLSVFAGNSYTQSFSQISDAVNNSFQYTIPLNAAGKILIQIVGVDSSGNVVSDSVVINVNPPATLQSITAYPINHYIPVGGLAHTNLIGHYSDGIDRNISDINGLSISVSNSNIASTESNLIHGQSIGTTTATFSFQGISTSIPVEIYKGEEWLTYGFENFNNGNTENVNQIETEDYIHIVPNPNSGQFNIEANNLTKGNIQIEIFNLLGEKIFTEELNNNSEIFDHNIDINSMSSGIYLIRLTDSNGKLYTNKISKN